MALSGMPHRRSRTMKAAITLFRAVKSYARALSMRFKQTLGFVMSQHP